MRVVGDDIDAGVYPIEEAIKMAEDLGANSEGFKTTQFPAANAPIAGLRAREMG